MHTNKSGVTRKLVPLKLSRKGGGGRFIMFNFINLSRLKDWRNILLLNPHRARIHPGFKLDYSFDKCNTSKHSRRIFSALSGQLHLTVIYIKMLHRFHNSEYLE